MSSQALGSRVGISGQGVRKLEQAEADASISLQTLRRLAEGLDCEMHYVLVPRTSLIDKVLTRAQDLASDNSSPSNRLEALPEEFDAHDTRLTLLARINRRGFW